jgi:hypothetical protein
VQGVLGAIIVFAGLGYFEVQATQITEKHRFFLEVFCFIVGMYESDFLGFLQQLTRRLLRRRDREDGQAQTV